MTLTAPNEFALDFAHVGCCAGYNIAEVTHKNGLRSVVEDKGGGIFTVLTFLAYMPHVPLIQGLSRAGIDTELTRAAAIQLPS